MEGEQTVGEASIVFQVAKEFGLAVAPGAQDAAVGVAHVIEQESGVVAGGIEVVGTVQSGAGFGEGAEHEAVPRCEHLVVEERVDALLTHFQQGGAGAGDGVG